MSHLDCDFIFFTQAAGRTQRKILDSDWDTGLASRKVIIETISKKIDAKAKILCIERPVSLLVTPLRHFLKFKRWVLRKNIVRHVFRNLYIYLPYTFLPDSLPLSINIITLLNRKLMGLQIDRVTRKYKFESARRIAWVYHPFQIDSLDLFNEDFVVFECHDEYTSSDEPLSKMAKKIIKRKEKELMKRADVVFVTSKKLYENKKVHNSSIFYIPNAADINFFKKTQDPNIGVSDKVKDIQKPIIGYLGTIHDRTDIELMTYTAKKRPDWSFVVVGPVERGYEKAPIYKRFKELPNVHLLGWTNYDELPAIAKAFDVCVIPYKVDSDFNQNVNPNKLHEYTAMGKPIVATNLSEVHSYKDIIKIAEDKDEFIDLIEQSIREDNREKIEERSRVADKNSWDIRVDQMLEIIREKIKNQHKKQI